MMDRLFERNTTLKLLSVLVAVLLWLQATAISGPTLPQSVREVPVQYRNLGQGLVVLSAQRTVTLAVRGRSEVLNHLSRDSFTAYVDLQNAGIGAGSFAVVVDSPEGISTVQVTPANVSVEVDAWHNAQVPVAVWTIGSPAGDHAMKSHTVRPTDLYVEGPRSAVQLVSRVVARVDIQGATSNISRTVVVRPVDAEGAEVAGVTVTPAAVDVQIAIVELPPASQLPARANVQGKPAAGYVQEPVVISPASIRVWAQGHVLSDLRYVWTYPIEIEGATATVERDVLLLVPSGVEKVDPTTVRVTVPISEVQEEREFRDVRIQVTGIGQGLKATVEPAVATVVVRGPRSRLSALTAGAISVAVDATGKAAGKYDAPVIVSLPEGLSARSVEPAEVELVVETQ